MKTIAYLRVSTEEQDTEKDKDSILRLANEKKLGNVEFVEEKISGKVSWKNRKINDIISVLENNDNLIVTEISRIGRSILDVMDLMKTCKEKHINIFSVKEKWELNDTMQSKVFATVFAMVAEIERDLISQRTKEALKMRKEKGVILGRPKGSFNSILDKHKESIVELLSLGLSVSKIAKLCNVSNTNLHNYIKSRKIKITNVKNIDDFINSSNKTT
jgi:DNA invertase Pin-like site-specific DNA recombinase